MQPDQLRAGLHMLMSNHVWFRPPSSESHRKDERTPVSLFQVVYPGLIHVGLLVLTLARKGEYD